MKAEHKIDIHEELRSLIAHDLGAQLFSRMGAEQLRKVAADIVNVDLYRFPTFVKLTAKALNLSDDLDGFVQRHIEHLLWAHKRVAMWRCGNQASRHSLACQTKVIGADYLMQTEGYPTIAISPMTLPYEDALWVTRKIFASRDLIMYGEDISMGGGFDKVNEVFGLKNFNVVGAGKSAPRAILQVLNKSGVFLTYPDFVYEGHKVHRTKFMGVEWPFSSSFLSLCMRENTMLLPVFLRRSSGNCLEITFEQPVYIAESMESSKDRIWAKHFIAATLADILQRLISREPAHWLLLSSLLAECRHKGM